MRVQVIARPALDRSAVDAFLDDVASGWRRSPGAGDAAHLVELAGRVCYLSFGTAQSARDNAAFIERLVCKGHESVLEHVSWTFLVAGLSRSCTAQVRSHRVGMTMSQLSQEYHEGAGPGFVMPALVRVHPDARRIWEESVSRLQSAYDEILDALRTSRATAAVRGRRGERLRAIRSAARSILPNAASTVFALTANARALRHFLTLRGAIEGDEEMRRLACALHDLLVKEAPALFFDFRSEELPDGSPVVRRVG